MPLERYLRLLDEVPALEARNGTMLPAHNLLIEQIAARDGVRVDAGSAWSAGSDAHTLRRVGDDVDRGARAARATSSSPACAQGLGRPGGAHGGDARRWPAMPTA